MKTLIKLLLYCILFLSCSAKFDSISERDFFYILGLSILSPLIKGGPKVVTPKFRLIARRFVAHSDTCLVNMMLPSSIRESNRLKYSTCSFLTTPFLTRKTCTDPTQSVAKRGKVPPPGFNLPPPMELL